MSQRILDKIREKVRLRQYLMTTHAEEEMDDDDLSIFDVERVLLTGKIVEQQKDVNTQEHKYLVRGQTMDGSTLAVAVTKFGMTGKLMILTVYLE